MFMFESARESRSHSGWTCSMISSRFVEKVLT